MGLCVEWTERHRTVLRPPGRAKAKWERDHQHGVYRTIFRIYAGELTGELCENNDRKFGPFLNETLD
jgi:hypothetical protein